LKLEHDFNDDLTLSNTATYSHSKADYMYTNPDDSKGNIYKGKVWRRATQPFVTPMHLQINFL
jgi:catecholate siderophore receptor